MIDHTADCTPALGGGCTCKAPPPYPGVTFHVTCPVCGAHLKFTHTDCEAWGYISLDDFATVTITAMCGNLITEHMNRHLRDKTWRHAMEVRAAYWQRRATRLKELEAI